VLAVSPSQALAVTLGRRQPHDGVERTLETPAVFAPGAFSQITAASGEHDSAQQQRLHARCEHGVAGLDRVGAVAQLMRQADLRYHVATATTALFRGVWSSGYHPEP